MLIFGWIRNNVKMNKRTVKPVLFLAFPGSNCAGREPEILEAFVVSDHNRVRGYFGNRDKSAWQSAACGDESRMSTSDLNSMSWGSRFEFVQVA